MKFEFDTTKLKEQIEDNPLLALGALGAALTGIAKIAGVGVEYKKSRTQAKEVKRRIKAAKK